MVKPHGVPGLWALALCAALVGAVPAPMLRKDRKASACGAERRRLQGQNPVASRDAACQECQEFAKEGPEGNAHLCTKCYSVKSSCDEAQFAWNCYDQNEMFEVFKNEGHEAVDEPSEMHSFSDKEPEVCAAAAL
mmetsp:Transcript_53569/g.138085  ORF Transcript_53569/g.138085 Transcript_53569/m.138085 type:complete len:135 (-) Transcript_53569:11-415(-)